MLIWQAHKGKIESAAFSADGRLLATATGGTRNVYLWEPTTGKLVRKLDGNDALDPNMNRVKSVAFAPHAPLVAAGTGRGVSVWRADTWERLGEVAVEYAHEVTFGPGAAPALAASNAVHLGLLALVDDVGVLDGGPKAPDRELVRIGGTASMHFSPDGTLLATTVTGSAVLWRTADLHQVRKLRTEPAPNRGAVRFSPDGTQVALTAGKWVEVQVVAGEPKALWRIQAGTGRSPLIWAVNWTADGRGLLTAGNDGCVRLWDAATGAERRTFDWRIGKLYCAAFSPDGLTCAACGEKGQVVIWDVDE